MKRIVYISGTRADYGLMRKTLQAIEANPELDLTIIATGMHLMKDFGETLNDILEDGFSPITVDVIHKGEERGGLALFFADFSRSLLKEISSLKPDHILVLGDRAEALAGAVIGTYLGISVVHIHGGDISGHVDDKVRHAITQLASLHLPATEKSAERIESMGISRDAIHVVGAPGMVGIRDGLMSRKEVEDLIGLPENSRYLLIVQHPVFQSRDKAGEQMLATVTAAMSFDYEVVISYPNADPGSEGMIEVIKRFEGDERVHIYRSLPHREFLSCMAYAEALVGNSSAGIIEAASFQLPVVNIGDREKNRERSGNVIDVSYDGDEIVAGIRKALSRDFREAVNSVTNVYGDGRTDERIVDLLVRW